MEQHKPCSDEVPSVTYKEPAIPAPEGLWSRFKENKPMAKFLAIILLIGFSAIIWSHRSFSLGSLIDAIIRDLGIAACVSVIIAAIIEIKLAEKTFVEGLTAIMHRTVPIPIWDDFLEHVIAQKMMRENMVITMDFKAGITEGKNYHQRSVSATRVKYTLVSLVSKPDTPASHHRDIHRTPKDASICGFSVKVGGDQIDHKVSNDGSVISFPVELSKKHQKEPIEYDFHELISVPISLYGR